MDRHLVAAEPELEPGSLRKICLGDVPVCLARTESGDWFAVADTCSHEEYSLSEGDLWGREIECPMHGSRFDLLTGKPDELPATEPIRTYGVVVDEGKVYVVDTEQNQEEA